MPNSLISKKKYWSILYGSRDDFQGILTFWVPIEKIIWSSVFKTMESAKQTMPIEDYAVSQSSLEQVVLMFVKDQKDERH